MDPLGGEIGDLAVNDGAMPLNEAYARNAAGYAVQVEWDNNSGSFGISPLKTPKIVTTTGHNPINAKLGTTESQSQVVLHSAVDINKLMLNVTLDNPKGGRPMLTLTSPSGQAIPINLPPVANFHGSLDLSPFIAGSNAKGNWVLSATDPGNSGITLKNWGLNASGIAEGAADVKN
jgi:subtilisin-like proprotein convertase family protein